MKLLTLALILIATTAIAAPPAKYGFRAISSASVVKCGVFGQTALKRNVTDITAIQGFGADPEHSRIYTLGTKGFANRSTAGLAAMSFTCVVSGTATTAPVNVFMDGVETYFLTTDAATFVIGK